MIMIDQYNMDQYNKETSQIHAPVDLIRRTKEAVRQEEQRIMNEKQQQNVVVQPKHSYAKVYKWALPVTAAIFCVIILNVGLLRFGRDIGGSTSASPTETASGAADSGDAGIALDAAQSSDMGFQSETIDMYEDTAEAAEDEAEYDHSSSAAGMTEGVTADTTNGVAEDATSKEMGAEEQSSYIDSIYGSDLWIEKVDEQPSFYADSDTESITIYGIEIYVDKDIDDTWIAYAQIGEEGYVIRGELTEESISQKEFIEKAYKLLEETMDRPE